MIVSAFRRKRWQASKIKGYEFRFQYACNGLIHIPPPDVPRGMLIRVKDGESMYLRPGAGPVPVAAELVQYATVEKLFAFIRQAWTSRPVHMEVQYDQARRLSDPCLRRSGNRFR